MIAEIEHNTFPLVSVPKGTFVVWRNKDSVVHSAEMNPDAEPYFTAGALHPGEDSTPVYFGTPGTYDYVCRYHHGMRGRITVTDDGEPNVTTGHPGHHDGHMTHYHGFVTGGQSASRLFMSHTPVMADARHRFQVILQGSIVEPEHVRAYEEARKGEFGCARWQVFHAHQDMEKIGLGEVSLLPKSAITYSPDGVREIDVPGLPTFETPVRIDRVLHFHRFEPEDKYPSDGLTYILYGDAKEVFMDHHITRAPNFHSVVKLGSPPSFWKGEGTMNITIPSKRIQEVSKQLPRVAYLDNAFHLAWLPPAGLTKPADPLIRRDESAPVYEVQLGDGSPGEIEIGAFLHFDVRLLNGGVFLPNED
ncbi:MULTISPECIES: cupredoxin domain-containing protein [Rhodococcus]|uniref:cupredoxin domain-containing protein n=1 Tax=Rhodococcus TaxID=1827 RepID=UPI0012F88C32|nr:MULTISPECIES: hypothetical protein [Rhodococcus]QQZ18436.1 hypothetical protein GO592_40355 [Rhodococcus sp. 21391]